MPHSTALPSLPQIFCALSALSALLYAAPLLADTPHSANLPPLPTPLSEGLHPLAIRGFAPALFAPPSKPSNTSPMPVVVFLHGIQADVEEQCGQWRNAARAYGWLLCIRGQRSERWSPRHNLWTHSNGRVAEREIQAALQSLQARFPSHVSLQNTVLAGYSRGAIIAPRIALSSTHTFSRLFLVEGGLDQLRAVTPHALKKRGVEAVAFAMGTYMRRSRTRALLPKLERADLPAIFVDMPKAGHRIGPHFDTTGTQAFLWLAEPRKLKIPILEPK